MFKHITIAAVAIASAIGVSGSLQAADKVTSGAGVQIKHERISYEKRVPCYRHEGNNKKKCLTEYKQQRKRDSLKYPPNPTRADVAKRVPDWQGFVRLGRCEQPGYSKYGDGVNWSHSGPTWGGGLGIYRSTWFMANSPYELWSGDKWETILVADSIRDQVGITAWGAHACFYG
jgi:hypothetical protein